MKLKLAILLFMGVACGAAPAAAQFVGSGQSFAVLGNTTVTNTGSTLISGNVGVSPGTSITGFPPGTLTSGTIYTGANAVVVQAQADAQALYNALVAKPCTTNLSGTDLGGLTLTPGVYCFDVAATLTAGNATLTLDAQHGSGVFVFQIGTTLTTGTISAVNVINGNAATGVFWQVGTSATIGAGTLFSGNILANTSVTVVSTAKITCGRAVALNGAVTMDTNSISNDCVANNFDTGRADFGSLGFAGAHASHDFNGDGYSDILWRDTAGDIAIWEMNGATILNENTAGLGNVSTTFSIVGQRDFNGDGYADFLWRDTSGNLAIWEMNGAAILNANTAGLGNVSTAWSVVGVGDFNGDGKADILWRNTTTGDLAIWEMNGTTILNANTAGVGNVPTNWSVVGVGDFNGDGMADILWRNNNNGNVAIWLMNGTTLTNSSTATFGNMPLTWSVAGTGDFNGDGMSDILWRDTAGDIAIWEMNGTTILNPSTSGVGNLSTVWSVAETGDFNGDGYADILWRDTSGDVAIWFMNGTTISSGASLGTISTTFTIQGTNAD